MASNTLTSKQEAFCKAFALSGNKSEAYRLAYDAENMSAKSINEKACELSKEVKIAERIKELTSVTTEIAEKEFQVTATEMLRHLNILRSAKIDDYITLTYPEYETNELDDNGDIVMRRSEIPDVKFKDFRDLTEEQLMCVESVKQGRNGIELKLHGKEWTIEKINKHIGFYEKDNAQRSAEVVIFELPNNDRQES